MNKKNLCFIFKSTLLPFLTVFFMLLFTSNGFSIEPQNSNGPWNKYKVDSYLYEISNVTDSHDKKVYMIPKNYIITIIDQDEKTTTFEVVEKRENEKSDTANKTNRRVIYTKKILDIETNQTTDSVNTQYSDVNVGNKYIIDNENIPLAGLIYHSGLVASALVIPYKFRLGIKDDLDSTLQPSSTIGIGVGYRHIMTDSLYFTVVGFGGCCLIPISDINSNTVDTKAGISLGGGFIFDTPKWLNIQVGVVGGVDRINNWEYNWDPWISFSIGFKFMSL